jgi:hypothetical protein
LQPRQLLKYLDNMSEQFDSDPSRLQPVAKRREPEPFEKLDLIYPDYDSYYRMSKQEKSHLAQYHPKNKSRDFFTEPRFLTRID